MSDVDIRIDGTAGRITLNRPEALNALSHDMALRIEDALDTWRSDPSVRLVVIDGAGGKAFCAGGDIQKLYQSGLEGDLSYGRQFWRDEYRLNAKIGAFPKPFVALMDGFVMGGGVGLSVHGSHRIVTEKSIVAMPESSIGFLPDVGGTFVLAQAPGNVGEYLAATGARMDGADAIYAGFADTFVPSERLPELIQALSRGNTDVLQKFAVDRKSADLTSQQASIDLVFSAKNVVEIPERLALLDTPWAEQTLKLIKRASPLSVTCAVHAVRQARKLSSLKDCLIQEYRFAYRAIEQSDFMEGIRAAVIDKDRKPVWKHNSLKDVSSSEAIILFDSLGYNELVL